VTAGLAESNGSLLPGNDLKSQIYLFICLFIYIIEIIHALPSKKCQFTIVIIIAFTVQIILSRPLRNSGLNPTSP